MATVPDRFIREKEIDYSGEILSALGCGLVTNEKRLRPFSIGVMSLLEILDNKCLKGEEASWFDYGSIFYINDMREKAVEDVADYSRGLTTPLEDKVASYIKKEKISILSMSAIEKTIEQAFTGFDMLPKTGSSSAFLFGADAIANITYVCCGKLNTTSEDILWNTPLTLIGHIVACDAVSNGVKGIGRRKDVDHLKAIFKKCKEWDEQNKLYPWQWLEPQFYPLEGYQTSREIKRDYDKRLKEVTHA
ncbi:MAG: hypothetical protein GY750_20985 [Lentisphaerae bacterium]|nr:hypothetical protein [Lentisphaerota bacterium]